VKPAVSGVSGGLAYLYLGEFAQPAVGASGAIFGLLGGVFGFTLRRGTFSARDPLLRQLLILTALNLFLGATIPNISNIAHVGGLVGGFVFGWLMAPTVYAQKTSKAAAPILLLAGAEAALLMLWLLFI
jgi:rhomboid protease GluP